MVATGGDRSHATDTQLRKDTEMRIKWDMSDGRFWDPVECDELFLMFDTDAHVSNGVPDVPVSDVHAHVAECDACQEAFVMVDRTSAAPVLLFDW